MQGGLNRQFQAARQLVGYPNPFFNVLIVC